MFQIAHITPSIEDLNFPVCNVDVKEGLENKSTKRFRHLVSNKTLNLPDDEGFIPGYVQHRGHIPQTKLNLHRKATVLPYLGRQKLLIVSDVISEPFLTAGDKTPDSVIGFLKRCGRISAT